MFGFLRTGIDIRVRIFTVFLFVLRLFEPTDPKYTRVYFSIELRLFKLKVFSLLITEPWVRMVREDGTEGVVGKQSMTPTRKLEFRLVFFGKFRVHRVI